MAKTVFLGVAAVAASGGIAFADGEALLTAPGGAFHAERVSGYIGELDANDGFDSFCVELNEFFTPGTTYYARISTVADGGGEDGGSPDPLSSRTALLYREYRDGGDFGGLGSIDTDGAETSFQDVVWASEDELDYADLTATQMAYYDWAEDNNDGSLYSVRVLQHWENADFTGAVQDFLTLVPLPPAAWAGLGSLACVAGIGYMRRRGQQA